MRRYSTREYWDDDYDYYGGNRNYDDKKPREYNRYTSVPNNRPTTRYNDDDEFTREIKVNKDFDPIISSRRRASEFDDFDRRKMAIQKRQPDHVVITDLAKIDIRALFIGAPPHTLKQTIKVDRLEDDLIFSLNSPDYYPLSSARSRRFSSTGENGTTSPLDEYDKVDEKINMEVKDGWVILTSRVRSEKVVPILGSEEMFKKSGVLVTRRIEVDLMATPTRRSLHELILWRQREGTTFATYSDWKYNANQPGGLKGLTKRENDEIKFAILGLAELYKMI